MVKFNIFKKRVKDTKDVADNGMPIWDGELVEGVFDGSDVPKEMPSL
jgi:hypothetical protein